MEKEKLDKGSEKRRKESFYFNYTLTKDDYEEFNWLVSKDKYKFVSRNKVFFGTMLSVLSLILLFLVILNPRVYIYYVILLIIIFTYGVYNLIYFPFFFAKNLKKAASRAYLDSENKLMGGNYKYDIREEEIEEKKSHSDGFLESHEFYKYNDIKRIYIANLGIILMYTQEKGIFLPSRISSSEVDGDLKRFMERKAQENEIQIFYEI